MTRLEPNGGRTTIVSGIKQPRWLAVSETGQLFISARRLTRDSDPEPDDESAEPEVILTIAADGAPRVFFDGFKHLQGLAIDGETVFAATRGRRDEPTSDGTVFRIPLLEDGTAGVASQLGPADALKRPIGLAVDRLGALYLTTKELSVAEDRSKRAVAKLRQDGVLTLFASDLDDPQGVAVGPSGDLYVADGRSGRVVRFQAPSPPVLGGLPPFTNQATLLLTGTTDPGARVDIAANGTLVQSGPADGSGAFSLSVALAPNVPNLLEVAATGHGGDGLTGAAAVSTTVHDDIPPSLTVQAPPAGAFVKGVVAVQADAVDAGSQLAHLDVTLGGVSLGATVTPTLPAPSASAIATWNTALVPDGAHGVTVLGSDRAGNSTTVTRAVIVDNTAPDTVITDGPSGSVPGPTATFTFSGSDNLTPAANLVFSWRLDGGAWSEFGSTTTASVSGLSQGPHVFAVRARDLAGNEDPTPAERSFTVGSLRVTITEPTNGATVPSGLLLVRGTVEGSGEIGVAVNEFVAAAQNGSFAVQVPGTPDTTGLTAIAATAGGATASHSIAIAVQQAPAPVALLATPVSGVSPLTVAFTLTTSVPATSVELDVDGDGTIDFSGSTLDGQSFTYGAPGLYVPTATVIDAQGQRFSARSVVQVYDAVALNAALVAKWAEMKDALRIGDIPRALTFIAAAARARYDTLFRVLAPRLASIDAILTTITLDEIEGEEAFYEMVRTDGDVTKSFEIRFGVDDDGVWRLQMF